MTNTDTATRHQRFTTADALHTVRLSEALALIPDDEPWTSARRDLVIHEYTASFWYAAGRIDEEEDNGQRRRHGTEHGFAICRAFAKAMYLTERRVDFGPMQGDWTDHLRGRAI